MTRHDVTANPAQKQEKAALNGVHRLRAYPPGALWCYQAHCLSHGSVVAYDDDGGNKGRYICSLCILEMAVSSFGTADEVASFCDRAIQVAQYVKPARRRRRAGRVVQQ